MRSSFFKGHICRRVLFEGEVWLFAADLCEILRTKTRDIRKVLGSNKLLRISNTKDMDVSISHRGKPHLLLSEEASRYLLSANRRLSFEDKAEFSNFLLDKGIYSTAKASLLSGCYEAERLIIVEDFLNTLGLSSERQYPIGGFFIDLYIPELDLAVEIDEEAHKYNKYKDAARQAFIEKSLKCKFLRNNVSDEAIGCFLGRLHIFIETYAKATSDTKLF